MAPAAALFRGLSCSVNVFGHARPWFSRRAFFLKAVESAPQMPRSSPRNSAASTGSEFSHDIGLEWQLVNPS